MFSFFKQVLKNILSFQKTCHLIFLGGIFIKLIIQCVIFYLIQEITYYYIFVPTNTVNWMTHNMFNSILYLKSNYFAILSSNVGRACKLSFLSLKQQQKAEQIIIFLAPITDLRLQCKPPPWNLERQTHPLKDSLNLLRWYRKPLET